jgi:hypothetical protein
LVPKRVVVRLLYDPDDDRATSGLWRGANTLYIDTADEPELKDLIGSSLKITCLDYGYYQDILEALYDMMLWHKITPEEGIAGTACAGSTKEETVVWFISVISSSTYERHRNTDRNCDSLWTPYALNRTPELGELVRKFSLTKYLLQ